MDRSFIVWFSFNRLAWVHNTPPSPPKKLNPQRLTDCFFAVVNYESDHKFLPFLRVLFFAMWYCCLCHHKTMSIFLLLASWNWRMICLGQWDISKYIQPEAANCLFCEPCPLLALYTWGTYKKNPGPAYQGMRDQMNQK